MKEITQFANHTVEIWRRPRQRHINLRVRPDGTLRVTCSKQVPKRAIFGFIEESEDFIKKSLRELAEFHRQHPPKKMVSGEEFLYFGTKQRLQLVWSWNKKVKVQFRDAELEMIAPVTATLDERKLALHKFYKREGAKYLRRCVAFWAEKMNCAPTSVSIRGQTSRWGSCSGRGEISLNWKLLAVPPEVIDYVVIHELAHMSHMDHSRNFWNLVGKFYPGYAKAKRWLRQFEAQIAVQFQKPKT